MKRQSSMKSWIDSDFDEELNLDGFDFAKPLPPIKKTLKAKPKTKPKTVESAPKPKEKFYMPNEQKRKNLKFYHNIWSYKTDDINCLSIPKN